MHTFGNILFKAGLACLVVGLLGLLSMMLQSIGVDFHFSVMPWYGPFLGGLLIGSIGYGIQAMNSKPIPASSS